MFAQVSFQNILTPSGSGHICFQKRIIFVCKFSDDQIAVGNICVSVYRSETRRKPKTASFLGINGERKLSKRKAKCSSDGECQINCTTERCRCIFATPAVTSTDSQQLNTSGYCKTDKILLSPGKLFKSSQNQTTILPVKTTVTPLTINISNGL